MRISDWSSDVCSSDLEVARLVDRGDRAQAHADRGRLPVLGHQPRMRVGAHAAAVDFHAEVVELGFGAAAFHERTRIDARRAVALTVEQVAGGLVARPAPELFKPA